MGDIWLYLSMRFVVSKVLTLMVLKLFKMTSPKAVCILFQAYCTYCYRIFPYRLVQNEVFNNLTSEQVAVCLLTRSTFSNWILSSNLSKLYFLNRGLKWQSQGWKQIILRVFSWRVNTLFVAFKFWAQTTWA